MIEKVRKRIRAARKQIPADLVLKKGKVVNVFSREIQEKDVAIYDGVIVGVGFGYAGRQEREIYGKWVVPGLIDAHIHIESSMLVPSRLAEVLLVHGTTTIVADPHEIANVMGLEGIRFMLRDSQGLPFDVFFTAPSCVPSTHLETSGATLTHTDLLGLKDESRVLGLAEMMNFPGVLSGNEEVLEKIVLFQDRTLDGHCPSLSGPDLQAYVTAGIRSDHETMKRSEGYEKLESGLMLMIREGTLTRNLEELVPLVNLGNARRFCLVSDDLSPEDIRRRGHLNSLARKAVKSGLDPLTALQLVTLNPSEYFGLRDRGAVSPGLLADLVILDDLENFRVGSVYKKGRLVVERGDVIGFPDSRSEDDFGRPEPLNMAPLSEDKLRIPFCEGRARVIEIVPGQIFTYMRFEEVASDNGFVTSHVESDLLKLCVVERHHATGRIGYGLVRGFGLKHGAIASSVAHDSHNVIAMGVKDKEILSALEAVREMGGGLSVVKEDEVIAKIPLEVAGLMSTAPLDDVVRRLRETKDAASNLGCVLEEPFMALSFLALPVIPELKLTDRGLVDVDKFEIVPLFQKDIT